MVHKKGKKEKFVCVKNFFVFESIQSVFANCTVLYAFDAPLKKKKREVCLWQEIFCVCFGTCTSLFDSSLSHAYYPNCNP
jgi:hypothetical protein